MGYQDKGMKRLLTLAGGLCNKGDTDWDPRNEDKSAFGDTEERRKATSRAERNRKYSKTAIKVINRTARQAEQE